MLAGKWEVKDLSDYPQAPPVDELVNHVYGERHAQGAFRFQAISASGRRMIPGWRWMC